MDVTVSDRTSYSSDPDYVEEEEDDSDYSNGYEKEVASAATPVTEMPLLAVLPEDSASREDGDQRKSRQQKRTRRKKVRTSILRWELWKKENRKWVKNKLKEEEEKFGVEGIELAVAANPSPDITLPLLRFQREWLAWALKQESSDIKGGILADEMGMGKTIQAISLVLTARSLGLKSSGFGLDMNASCSSSSLPETKCTLVVCPLVAVIQWADEINRHTAKGSSKVLVYHGAKRDKTSYDFNDYDFVITTYSTIESEFRKHMMPPKEKCQWCGKMLYPDSMRTHLRYFCGPSACKTEKQSKQESKKNKYGILKGKEKKIYKTKKPAAVNGKTASSHLGKSILHSVKWQRIILDEVSIYQKFQMFLHYF